MRLTGPGILVGGAARDFVTPGKTASSTARATQTISAASFPRLLFLTSSAEAQQTTTRNLAKSEYARVWTTVNDVARNCSTAEN